VNLGVTSVGVGRAAAGEPLPEDDDDGEVVGLDGGERVRG
jgi:hypothetical protein